MDMRHHAATMPQISDLPLPLGSLPSLKSSNFHRNGYLEANSSGIQSIQQQTALA
jgi:hypothetical protein